MFIVVFVVRVIDVDVDFDVVVSAVVVDVAVDCLPFGNSSHPCLFIIFFFFV